MGIQHKQSVPPSFSDAFSDNYLGNPEVANRLVSGFLANVESVIHQRGTGKMDAATGASTLRQLVLDAAGAVSGRNPSFKPIAGYHSVSLPMKLRADLGEFWQSHRASWDDDSVCVLFEWLALMLFDAMKRSDGDDTLMGVILRPSVEYAVEVILGTEKRVGP